MTADEQLADTIRPPKACGCGALYDACAWRALPLVGIQDAGDGDELELRNCATCSSTIAIELPNRQDREAAARNVSEPEPAVSAVRVRPVGELSC